MKILYKILLFLSLFSPLLYGQTTLDITATATVLAPITYSATRNLNFGDVLPNITKTISVSDNSNAGLFTINGETNKEIQVTVTKPSELIGPESATLPINFTTGEGVIATAASSEGVKTTQPGTVIVNLTSGRLYFFIGGSISPSSSQAPGAYTGTVTFNTVYTGN